MKQTLRDVGHILGAGAAAGAMMIAVLLWLCPPQPAQAQTTGAITLMDAGTRTATTTAERVINTQAKGATFTLNVTAASGTTPTLDVKLQWQDPVSSTWNDISGAVFQRITTTGSRTLTVYPAPEGGGLRRVITGTNPAAGAQWSETVPANTRWRLLAGRFPIATDATVASRVARVILDDGTTGFIQGASASSISASTSYTAQAAGQWGFSTGASGSMVGFPLQLPVDLYGGWRISSAGDSFQAGDDWGAPILFVEEWIGNYAAIALPRFIRAVATIGGTTPSFTFSVGGSVLP